MHRLDQILVTQKIVTSRTLAQKLIAQGCVEVFHNNTWQRAEKASQKFTSDINVRVLENALQKYVSRAGLKLEAALKHCEYSPIGQNVLDIGQSTGGFSDCLLQHGAKKVIGIDVGHSQLHSSLINHADVVCLEGINARALSSEAKLSSLAKDISLVVMDLSFISQTLVLPELPIVMGQPFDLISLVKPQFEVGKQGIGKGGLVRDKRLYRDVEQLICNNLEELGFRVLDYFDSPIAGGDGNKEFFVYARKA